MKVLLIVDVQNDFCPGGRLAVTDGDKIVPIINKLMSSGGYDLQIATKDWHPQNHVSFAIWPAHCVVGTEGAEFHPELDTSKIDKVIFKGFDPAVDSYSGFFDNNHEHETRLLDYLKTYCKICKIPLSDVEIDICGLALDFCVKATAIDAAALGFKTKVIYDATRSVFPEKDIEVCRQLTGAGKVEIIESLEAHALREITQSEPSRTERAHGLQLHP